MEKDIKLFCRIFLLGHLFIAECQITSVISPKIACVGDDVDIDWVYDDASNFLSVTWTYINSQTSARTIIMKQTIGGSATVYDNYNVVHKTNGGIKMIGVTLANSGSYTISVSYISTTSPDDDTVAVTVNDCSTTRTTTSTTSTTTSTSTRTTTPASTTTTTPASTATAMPITTTTMRTSITNSKSPTTSTKLSTISTSSTKSSNGGLSNAMIIVIVVVPVGVIVGTIIFFCLFYRLRRVGKRKPTSHERNIRSVQQQYQQPYILYGRGHTRQFTH